MNGWHAAVCALLSLVPGVAAAADDLTGAARELAQKTAAFAGKGAPVSASWSNISSLGPAELGQAQAAFEAALASTGAPVRPGSDSAVQARVTLSENALDYLLVEEAQKGEERQVWLASWKRAPAGSAAPPAAIEKRLLREQDEQILDFALESDDVMLLLSPASLTWFNRQNGVYTRGVSVALPQTHTWPRDVRGRLRVNGSSYQAYLPGMACAGSWRAPVTLDCRDSEDPWVLESGTRALLLANYAAARNYFDGRIATQSGQRKTVPPF